MRCILSSGSAISTRLPAENIQGTEELQNGHILVVNRKFDFAVVDLGTDNGLQPGTGLGVYRGGKLVAMLEVEKVHSNMSAAKIPPEWKGSAVKEGDTVTVIE